MSTHLNRLRRGERWWVAEVVLRATGFALLSGCYRLALLAHWMATTPAPHEATLGEFAVCAAIILSLTSGLALTLFGPGLFKEVPIPRGSKWYWKAL